MKLRPLKTIQDLEYVLSKLQGYFSEYTNQLSLNPFLSGTMIEAQILTTDTTLNHGLQTEPSGWMILDKNANANIWKISQDNKTLILRASAAVSCKVWVF